MSSTYRRFPPLFLGLLLMQAGGLHADLAGRTTILLDGMWQLAAGDAQPTKFTSSAPVPGIATMAVPALGVELHGTESPADYRLPWRSIWYRRVFTLAGQPRAHALLRVRAKYNARVFLNGRELGYDPHTTYSHGEFDASKAVRYDAENELLVQVGTWETASSPSKELKSCWWRSSRSPGLWDSVMLELFDNPRIAEVQIVPGRDLASAAAHVTVENRSDSKVTAQVRGEIRARDGGVVSGALQPAAVDLAAGERRVITLNFMCRRVTPWSSGKEGTPALYVAALETTDSSGAVLDSTQTTFGFRTFEIHGADIYGNGRRAFMRAGNVAFNRALLRWSDQLFDRDWVRRFLTILRDDYGYNLLRSHICHMPSFWYDIADEVGLMIHDEWRYFHDADPQGRDREEARIELTRWVHQNVNHPSIIIWDNENEGDVVLADLVADLRAYDPTRPWGEEDFDADHVYRYSETDTDTVVDARAPDKPSTVWESCRFWLNEQGLPEPREAFKTVRTITAWNFHYYNADDALRLQADLHADIGTFYRTHRFAAWAPFAVLSGPINGQTFFLGDLGAGFRPQPNLEVIQDLHARFGVSIEMWGAREWYRERRIYPPGGITEKSVAVWNDHDAPRTGRVVARVIREADGHVLSEQTFGVTVPSGEAVRRTVAFRLPAEAGIVTLRCELLDGNGAHVAFGPPRRLMVAAADSPALDGVEGFGGRYAPLPGAVHFTEAFLGAPVPEAVRSSLKRELAGQPVGEIRRFGSVPANVIYRVEAGRKTEQITLDIMNDGRVVDAARRRRMPFTALPMVVQTSVRSALGFVPLDEAQILRYEGAKGIRYEVKAAWDNGERTLCFDEEGRPLPFGSHP